VRELREAPQRNAAPAIGANVFGCLPSVR